MSSPRFASLDIKEFQNPGARPRIAPFWFWNCGMEEEKIRRQIQQMAQAGCGGFFIHPRQGLTLPYLSKEWFSRVRLAVEEAKNHGLEVWLYDEYPYPSGIAGGLLTANRPEFRERVMEHKAFEAVGDEPLHLELTLGRLVCALACPLKNGRVDWTKAIDIRENVGVVLTREQFWYWPMGHITTNEKRFMADEGRLVLKWTPPSGEWRIFIGVERDQRGFKYYDCFFDPLVPGAAQEFLRLTHERYATELGEFFGNTIPGIFTDETEPPHWSPQIEAELAATGIDFSQLLPALRHDDHPQASEIRLQWRQTALRLFQERWETPIANWCREHKLIWGAEKPTWRPSQFWNIEEPATDAGHRRIPAPPEPLTVQLRANHRAAMSAAEQRGGETVRCECFHSLGWGATLQDQKWAIDWLTVQGVNRFTPHAFYATSSGLQKHDAAPSFFAENPYWVHFRLLADYTARLSLAMSTGRERSRLAVLHPTEALWSGDKASTAVRAAYEGLQNTLLARHFPFHVVDAQALLQAEVIEGGLELGNVRYETLIVPQLMHQEQEIESALTKAKEAGLTVLGPLSLDQLEKQRPLSVKDERGSEIETVWALWRETDEQNLLFLANTAGESVTAHIEVTCDSAHWEQWSLETGAADLVGTQSKNNKSHLSLQLPAYGSALLVGTSRETQSPSPSPSDMPSSKIYPLDEVWYLKLDRPNALRLNRWRAVSSSLTCSGTDLDDTNWQEIEALPLRHLDQTGGGWIQQIERYEGDTVWYRRHIECDVVPENLEILIEEGAILGDWMLFVNGVSISAEAFKPRIYNGEDKTAAQIAPYFQTGFNVLAIRVKNAPEMGGLRTPLHLLGDFGLGGESNRKLTSLPVQEAFHNLPDAGLPHFSGTVTYSRMVDCSVPITIEMPGGFGDVAEVSAAGKSLGVRAWSPYRWEIPVAPELVEIQIAVTNTLLPFVEGQVWNGTMRQPRNV